MSDKILNHPDVKEIDTEMEHLRYMMDKLARDYENARKMRDIVIKNLEGTSVDNSSLNRNFMVEVKP